ncbi:MAG: cytochrome b, partial [Alphaproteobacteria bacterium]|nr:cytochrome b [Alphaproteobacteria bacterium]
MRAHYHSLSIGLHWIMAVIIVALLACGFYMTGLEPSSQKFQLYNLHKSFGLIILMLVALRFAWRLRVVPPPALETHKPWERMLAHLTHWAFYLLMLGLPISGLLMSAAGDFPVRFFNLFSVPPLIGKDEKFFDILVEGHEIMASIIMGLIALHVAGALKHHF